MQRKQVHIDHGIIGSSDRDIIYHDLQHEELLVCYPEKWANDVEDCCGIIEK